MGASAACEEFRDLASELALGVATGEQRAHALEHLAGCADCRRHLAELSEVADGLLALAPEREPGPGFETRVLERLGLVAREPVRPWRARWPRRLMAPAAAALATGALVLTFAYRDDRQLASDYRATLAEAHGEYFRAARLYGPGRLEAGQVFGYQGRPSWLLVVVRSRLGSGRFALEAVLRDGSRMALGPIRLVRGAGSKGQTIERRLDDVVEVRVVGARAGQLLEADLPVSQR
jgi:hypothetical protein